MIIRIPNNNIKEREYSINTIFKKFLSLDYSIEYTNSSDYSIILDNGKTLTIKDAFFSKYPTEKEYLHIDNIPTNTTELQSNYYKDILVLFGENIIITEDNNITIYADIIAGAFFMLTRWEEYVNKTRDKHNRFPATESVAYKQGFLDRPIVNEYIEFLWSILMHLGYKGKRKEYKYEMTLTHDVDIPRLWWSFKDFIKSIGGSLLKRKSISECLMLLKFKLKGKDPFDTFDYLMNISESNNLKSHFFFMSGGTSNKDNFYKVDHPKIKKLIAVIKKRGHYVGFHPSYNAYNNDTQFKKELLKLKEITKLEITTGREHFLRFENPTTWQIWEDNNMQWDSTMTYHDKPGFRCGVCYEFPVFNILTRKQLNLIEKPLIVMEGSFITYQNISPTMMSDEIQNLVNKVKEFNGNFVFLWHNSAFNIGKSKKYQHLYKTIVNKNSN